MVDRYTQLNKDISDWIAQERKDIVLDNQKGYTIDIYGLSVRLSWYIQNNQRGRTGNKIDYVRQLFQKAQVSKGGTILVDMKGQKWKKEPRKGWVIQVPKRVLSQASVLKNRYRRGLITLPRNIAKIEAAVEESKLELPILEAEIQRLDSSIEGARNRFEQVYGMKLKPYPYHQSVAGFAGKVPSATFFELREEFWRIKQMCARMEDLHSRSRRIGRDCRTAAYRIKSLQDEMKKLGHGQNPKVKRSWETQ